ncbi:MAG: site-specific integrase [Muribaculaceae bacterium]|nr:site-specific integrase [Muribaculaceae bacterium]
MAKLSLTIRKSQPNHDGSFNIKVAVAAKGKTCFIPTFYNVRSEREWVNGRVARRPDADLLNRKLQLLLMSYEDIMADNPGCGMMDCCMLRDYIIRRASHTELVGDFGRRYVEELEAKGQDSYARNMGYTLRYLSECFGEGLTFGELNLSQLMRWEAFLFAMGNSSTTVNIRMTHLKALLNAAVDEEVATYKVFPFRKYRMPGKVVRDLCVGVEDLRRIRDAVFTGPSERRMSVARDLFMLSFYCAGINLTDIVDADWRGDKLRFVRKKTERSKQGEKLVSMSIQPEAREIVNRYMGEDGRLDFGYGFSDYGQFRSFVTKSLNRLGEVLNLEKRLMFYSARKSFCQLGSELGVPLYVLEYAIGHTIKDANSRPIFNYIRVMEGQADEAIRCVLDLLGEVANG